MTRTTIADLNETAAELTRLTGFEHVLYPGGSGFWSLYYKKPNDKGDFDQVEIANRKMKELNEFMDAYRRGFGRCLDAMKPNAMLRVNLSHLSYHRPTATMRIPIVLTGNTKVIEECSSPRNPMDAEKLHYEIVTNGERHWVCGFYVELNVPEIVSRK